MERPRLLAILPAVVAINACTMIGSPELAAPPAPTAADIPDITPRAEPPSRGGNLAEYEQNGATYQVLDTSRGYDERGIASWYGEDFHGRLTSSGDVYDMYLMTAAHKTLPLPTYVRVTHLANGRSVVLRVNDRGPFVEDRIIDLSYTAATKLGMAEQGTARVEVVALDPPARDRTR